MQPHREDIEKELSKTKAQLAQLQAEVDAYRERFYLVVESANDGLWDWEVETDTLYNSPRWKETLGFQDDELIPSVATWKDLVHPEDLPYVIKALEGHLEGKLPFYRAEYRMRTKQNNYIWVLDRGKARFDENGRPTHVAGSLTDITERKSNEEKLAENERRLRTILTCMNEGILVLDQDAKFVYSNPSFSRMLGLSVDQVEGRTPLDPKWRVIHEDGSPDPGETHPSWLTLKTGKPIHNRIQGVYTADGKLNWLLANSEPMFHPETHQITGVVVTFSDITERKHREQQLRLTAQVFEYSQEAIVIANAERKILTVNRAFSEITGYGNEEAVGREMLFHCVNTYPGSDENSLWQEVIQQGHWRGETRNRRRDGEDYSELASISSVKNEQNEVTHFICVASDITERKNAERRIENLAYYDALTDLPNRVMFQDRLDQALALARREQFSLAVLMIDLDRFKIINDSLGHMVGDHLLRQVARRLQQCVREVDTISRMGGDEFVAVLLDVDANGAAHVAIRILNKLAGAYEIEGYRLNNTASIGISIFPNDGRDNETLIKQADAAMYHAKDSGRHNYKFFTDDMNASALERIVLENGLRDALERNELLLHYQPQLDTVTGRLLGAEALLRWNHPEKGLISPGRFIPVAEETGLIVPIGGWVIREVCRQIRVWLDDGLDVCRISINLAAQQLREIDLIDTVCAALNEKRVEPHLLEFELTESTLMSENATTDQHLQAFDSLGVELSIDDFGTGYSSLSYLKRFPFDRLKIDRSFVQDLANNPDDEAIVSSVIGLSKNLKMEVIAEGVETEEQLVLLQKLGCNAAQGFLFSKPLTSENFAIYLRDYRVEEKNGSCG